MDKVHAEQAASTVTKATAKFVESYAGALKAKNDSRVK
jgi:hypothetical protein